MAKFDHSPGTSREDFEAAYDERLSDARCLLASDRFAMAAAMAIYALEIELKVCICHRLELARLPKGLEVHELRPLLRMSGLESRLSGQDDDTLEVKRNFDSLVESSSQLNDLRYGPAERTACDRAKAERVLRELTDEQHGVLPWLRRQRT